MAPHLARGQSVASVRAAACAASGREQRTYEVCAYERERMHGH